MVEKFVFMKIVKVCIFLMFLTMTLHRAIAEQTDTGIEAGTLLEYSVYVGESFELPVILPTNAYCEVPAWAVTDDTGSRYFLPTGFSYAAYKNPETSILEDSDAFSGQPVTLTSTSDIRASNYADPSMLDPDTVWRRNYYGIYTAHYLSSGFGGQSGYLAFLHGENKNERIDAYNRYYDNTVLPTQSYIIPDEYSGYTNNGSYQEYWPAYFAFIFVAWSPSDENGGNNFSAYDLGPVLWPSSGYVTEDGTKAGNGLRAPSTILYNGYIYIFYNDQGGIKVSRAPVSGNGAPGTFMNYYKGAFSKPSLPEGFTKETVRDFLDVPGGKSAYIHSDLTMRTTRFSVAKLEGTKYFVGVEERFHYENEQAIFQNYLRLSEDLVNWSDAVSLPGTASQYGTGLDNPVLVNSDYTSNTLVSPDGFYVVGSGWSDATMKGIKVCFEGKLAHWALDDSLSDPNYIEDITGNGFEGTGITPLTFVPGKIDKAVEISSGNFISIDQVINRPERLTLSSWVKTNASGAIFSFRDSVNGTYSCFEIEQGNDGLAGALRYGQWDGSTWQEITTARTINDNQWHHVAMTYDQGNVVLYIDGLDHDHGTLTNNENSSVVDELLIGSNQWQTFIYEGMLDDIQLYNFAMMKAQIADLYLETEDFICIGEVDYDLNDDCIVDIQDLSLIITQWLACNQYGSTKCDNVELP